MRPPAATKSPLSFIDGNRFFIARSAIRLMPKSVASSPKNPSPLLNNLQSKRSIRSARDWPRTTSHDQTSKRWANEPHKYLISPRAITCQWDLGAQKCSLSEPQAQLSCHESFGSVFKNRLKITTKSLLRGAAKREEQLRGVVVLLHPVAKMQHWVSLSVVRGDRASDKPRHR